MNIFSKFWLLFFIGSGYGVFTNAVQAQKTLDAVYLKNGSIIRGQIVTPLDTSKVAIESSKNLFVYNKSEVQAIKNENNVPNDRSYVVAVSAALFGGDQMSTGFRILAGYKFKHRFFVGTGSGIENFNNLYIPIFAEGSYSFSKAMTQPYVYASGGYSLPGRNNRYNNYWENTRYLGGPMYAIGLGVKRYFSNAAGFEFKLGYRFQQTTTTTTYGWSNANITVTDNFNRIELGMGLFL